MVRAYKGVTKELTGHGGYQFELGKKYVESKAKIASSGFHAGSSIYICWRNGFSPDADRIFEVELDGVIDEKLEVGGGKTYAATEITFVREIPYDELCEILYMGGGAV